MKQELSSWESKLLSEKGGTYVSTKIIIQEYLKVEAVTCLTTWNMFTVNISRSM